MKTVPTVIEVETAEQVETARRLFREYEAFLGENLCFQGFEAELAGLPGKYARPHGALLLAREAGQTIGCGALRQLEASTCEMKRLYVRPEFRGRGVGKILAERLIGEAVQLGYSSMVLDTLERLTAALKLYELLGFARVEGYYPSPLPGVVYLRLELVQGSVTTTLKERASQSEGGILHR